MCQRMHLHRCVLVFDRGNIQVADIGANAHSCNQQLSWNRDEWVRYSSLDARVVKGVDLRSTGLQAAWVRTPLQADCLLRRRAQIFFCIDVRGPGLFSGW